MAQQLLIKKEDGTNEVFNENKLRRSLERAGASKSNIEIVVSRILKDVKPYMTTGEIYREAFHILSQLGGAEAAKYSLRRAIMQLGPSGFPFERFMAKVLEEKGYKTRVGVQVKGKCGEYEIDIIAKKEKKIILVEAKFHNTGGVKSDMKVVLYVHARYNDLEAVRLKGLDAENLEHEFWLITNTKFTRNSINYGKCAGVTMIGWSYPEKGNIQDMIEESGLQPITCLTTLLNSEKESILNKSIVLCKDLLDNPQILSDAGLDKERQVKAIQELKSLYK